MSGIAVIVFFNSVVGDIILKRVPDGKSSVTLR
jgi:hypothetical protein